MKYFYEKTDYNKFKSNIFYDNILGMDECQFTAWVKLLRLEVIQNWNIGIPPVVGKNEIDIIKSFQKMRRFFTPELILLDKDCLGIIRNFNKCGSECNQFFPTMLKTRITTGKNPNKAKSIYDVISKDSFLDSFIHIMKRALKRDSMYIYSKSLTEQTNDDEICYMGGDGYKWIIDNIKKLTNYGIWLNEVDSCGDEYVYLTKSDINHLIGSNHITNKELTNIGELDPDKKYLIRYYKKNQPIFPGIIQILRLSLGTQPVVNFPPTTAKFLYEKYTEHIQKDVINIYDPSAGWGGRILGAMSLPKRVHYIGTDPNMDNFISGPNITRYGYLADFYNNNCIDSTNDNFNKFFESNDNKNTYDIYSLGSEIIHLYPDFQKYKGKLDFVFTSPPYFNRERYGDSDGQSYIQYPEYEDWKDNFLKPTLKTAVEYLANDRYLAWNIASIKIGKDEYLPLQEDSRKALEDLGMEYIGYYKMLMTKMIGIRPKEVLNCVEINGVWYKHEPIYVYHKK